ncbi:hypothetical protein HPG69_005773 [Diceros bicornis minor]|uniref:B30.2/SPRY domain-containing protein n=1 Tax=Diceros bicornis minor TaxID=77932 RepID=A0A7J7ESD9_DICBM|nr:hypothetical protein HPG69_005773 [Diceros bicornis minor]
MVSKKLKRVFRVPDLSGMLQEFKGEESQRKGFLSVLLISDTSTPVPPSQLPKLLITMSRDTPTLYLSPDPVILPTVDVMLNPVNSIPDIVVSADRRQVRVVHPVTFENTHLRDFGVLGHQCFSSGKYYWEVDVSEKTAWILGVHSEENDLIKTYVRRVVLFHRIYHPNAYSRYRPRYGYWVIGLQNGSEYTAFEDTPISATKALTLSMTVLPRRVGVFLDYEAGTVSFLNVTNHGSLIYKFSKFDFSCTVSPYFNPWNCPGPITLCPPSS